MRIVVHNTTEFTKALDEVKAFALKRGYPVEIRVNVASSKRMEQLGGLFGVWVKEYSEQTGVGQNSVHAQWKRQFLERIYLSNPIGQLQTQWVELYLIYQEREDFDKLELHRDRISLSWAKVHQMSDYMNAIFNDCADNGIFLSPLEKNR